MAVIEKDAALGVLLLKEAQVSPYQQDTEWSCSAACLKSVLEHYGKPISELKAVDVIGARPKRGAEVDEVAEGARKLGFDAFHYLFDSLDQAKTLLDQDIPLILDVQSWNHPGKGHYVVLHDVDDGHAYLMDPNTPGNQRVITREELEDRWWDYAMEPPHKLMVKWGIVVLPPEKPQ